MRYLLISLLLITGNIFASDIQADPLSKVGNLLDNNGGISTGENKKTFVS